MKWIGQHIFDLIARFRSGEIWLGNGSVDSVLKAEDSAHDAAGTDVTLQAGSPEAGTTSLIEGGHLYLKAGLSKGSAYGGNIYIYGGNRGVGGATTLNTQKLLGKLDSSSNYLFLSDTSGTNFGIQATDRDDDDGIGGSLFVRAGGAKGTNQAGGNLVLYGGRSTGTGNGGEIQMRLSMNSTSGDGLNGTYEYWTWDQYGGLTASSGIADNPELTLQTTNTGGANSAKLTFRKNAVDSVDDEYLGQISFYGEDSGNGDTLFAHILGQIQEVDDTDEAGKLTLSVATSDGSTSALQQGIKLYGHATNNDVDVELGYGSTSLVSITGFLNIAGHAVNDIDIGGEFVDSDEHLMTSAAINDRIAAAGGGIAFDGSTANGVLTYKDSDEAAVESTLTYDSETLNIGVDDDGASTIKRTPHSDGTGGQLYIRGGDATAGQTDTAGGNLTLFGGRSTGNAGGGSVVIQSNPASGSTGTTVNSSNVVATFRSDGDVLLTGSLSFEGATPDAHEIFLTPVDPGADATITIPATTGIMSVGYHGSADTIRVLPNQFFPNDDVGRPAMIEDDTSNILGVRCAHTSDELYAFQQIPTGYKVTHVQVHASASTSSAVTVRSFNYQTGADNNVSETSGDLNANIDATDIPSSATQDLVIKVAPASASTIIYGATVTIATI